MNSLICCIGFLLPVVFAETIITPYTTDDNGVVTFAVSFFWINSNEKKNSFQSDSVCMYNGVTASLEVQTIRENKNVTKLWTFSMQEPLANNDCWQFTWVGAIDETDQTQPRTCK